jgi:hypothetical protein
MAALAARSFGRCFSARGGWGGRAATWGEAASEERGVESVGMTSGVGSDGTVDRGVAVGCGGRLDAMADIIAWRWQGMAKMPPAA